MEQGTTFEIKDSIPHLNTDSTTIFINNSMLVLRGGKWIGAYTFKCIRCDKDSTPHYTNGMDYEHICYNCVKQVNLTKSYETVFNWKSR